MAGDNREKFHIKLHVYDSDLNVAINRDEEALCRNAAKLADDTVNYYSSRFKGKRSEKDILYMSLIEIALRYEKESKRNDTAPYSDILNQLTSEIEQALSDN